MLLPPLLPHRRRTSAAGCSVNHLTAAPKGSEFACAAGKLITIFTLGASAAAAPAKRVLGPLPSTIESLRYDRRGNLLATYNGGVSFWNLCSRGEEEKQELPLPAPGAMLCGDVTPGAPARLLLACAAAALPCQALRLP